ncbi:hypothetical protein LAWI1_G003779, partial [Lachnellula willkommii]
MPGLRLVWILRPSMSCRNYPFSIPTRRKMTVESDDEETSENEEEEEDEKENERRMHLESWTDPFFLEPEEKYIESWCIPLTSANHGGYVLILDYKTTLDMTSPKLLPTLIKGTIAISRPGPLPMFSRSGWVAYYRDLVIAPDYRHGNWWFGDEGEMGGEEEGKEVRQMLLNYGWPDNFHEEESKAALVPWKEMKDEAEGADMEAEDARIKEAAKDSVLIATNTNQLIYESHDCKAEYGVPSE